MLALPEPQTLLLETPGSLNMSFSLFRICSSNLLWASLVVLIASSWEQQQEPLLQWDFCFQLCSTWKFAKRATFPVQSQTSPLTPKCLQWDLAWKAFPGPVPKQGSPPLPEQWRDEMCPPSLIQDTLESWWSGRWRGRQEDRERARWVERETKSCIRQQAEMHELLLPLGEGMVYVIIQPLWMHWILPFLY